MSATRDRSQKFGFVFSNLYHLYKNQPVEVTAPTLERVETGKVIKAHDLHKASLPEAEKVIKPYKPAELIAKRVEDHALASLKQNLGKLNDLHSKLKFMLEELEALNKS